MFLLVTAGLDPAAHQKRADALMGGSLKGCHDMVG
jgi:hypothetical protein